LFVFLVFSTTAAARTMAGTTATRGAEYAKTLHGVAYDLPNDRFELLYYACVWHTDGEHHDDPTIATCWDADRLDLGRVGMVPDPDFMSTDFGREIAAYGSIEPFIQSTANFHPPPTSIHRAVRMKRAGQT
jgi:hypothetical protein